MREANQDFKINFQNHEFNWNSNNNIIAWNKPTRTSAMNEKMKQNLKEKKKESNLNVIFFFYLSQKSNSENHKILHIHGEQNFSCIFLYFENIFLQFEIIWSSNSLQD